MWLILFIPDCVVIYSKSQQIFKEFTTINMTIDALNKEIKAPIWPDNKCRGCPLPSGMIITGSTDQEHRRKVELLGVSDAGPKTLPELMFPTACAGMAWNREDNALILAGGDQFKNGNWNATSDMFQLINVGKDNSVWKELSCKLPLALICEKLKRDLPSGLASPELLIGGNYLYLLGGHASLKCARIKDDFKGNWEKLPDLLHDFDSSTGTGGAVFINHQVVVFTLEYIMKLTGNGEEASWDPISIKNKGLRRCIPRLFNGDIIVLMERLRDNGNTETIIERYNIEDGVWKSLTTSDNEDQIRDACLDPWKFFIRHYALNADDI